MSDTPKWKTKAYKTTGWVCIATFISVWLVDGALLLLKQPTISSYVSARAEDQPLFMWIVIGFIAWLIFHWFWRVWKK